MFWAATVSRVICYSVTMFTCYIHHCCVQLEIKIPLVKLTFVSKTGLKRIPKKRPADRATCKQLHSTTLGTLLFAGT